MDVKIKLLSPSAKIPTKAHDDDFAYDVYAVSEEEIAPNVWKYGLGIALQIPQVAHVAREGFSIRPRSSVWKTGMVLSNCVGTIDAGYTGEISMVFYHVMPDMPRYKVGDRIGQIYTDVTMEMKFCQVNELDVTSRGDGGYGSTGK